ncbi:MAG TPA: hypothetical protein VFM18_21410 [Methanosarcina sp.]|nr:hypothetical protein [Methanosarcina sp.]
MSVILPPQPNGQPPNSPFWNDWYNKLRSLVNNIGTSIQWVNLNFAGSKIEDIASRQHNKLQSIQGGATAEYNHLSNNEYARVQNSILVVTSAAADPTTTDIAAGTARIYKNTTSGTVKLWTNDGGTMKSVALT